MNIKNDKIISVDSWKATDILAATGGRLLRGTMEQTFTGISIDSRTIRESELFMAIKGEIHDGHDFINEVVRKGIRGVVINDDMAGKIPAHDYQEEIVFISVKDTTRALGDLAFYKRKHSSVSVVAITGSNGKTTTREMTASIVSQGFSILSTSGNFNNEIGLPLTLSQLNESHEWAILELAMNRPGEIKRLAEICLPEIGLITNIGPAHLEGLGSLEGVVRAKGELLEGLNPKGTAVLNADDPMTVKLAQKAPAGILFFGLSDRASIRAEELRETPTGTSFTLVLPDKRIPVDLKAPGSFMVLNALGAAAVGYLLGLSAADIQTGLENFRPVQGRLNIVHTSAGIHIIDDTYNANPASMGAAISTLQQLKKENRAILVAGDMLELGDQSLSLHEQIGSLSGNSDIANLYITGKYAEAVARGARKTGMNPKSIYIGSKDEILKKLFSRLKAGDWVLVKGSRAIGMEKIITGITDRFNTIKG